jgi:hypothetical protein
VIGPKGRGNISPAEVLAGYLQFRGGPSTRRP